MRPARLRQQLPVNFLAVVEIPAIEKKAQVAIESGHGEIPEDRSRRLCEGGVDVVGVVTPLRGGAQVVLHGDQVVELSVLLGVHEKEEVEEDGEGQVEVEREEGEVKEKRTWDDYADGMRLKNT